MLAERERLDAKWASNARHSRQLSACFTERSGQPRLKIPPWRGACLSAPDVTTRAGAGPLGCHLVCVLHLPMLGIYVISKK